MRTITALIVVPFSLVLFLIGCPTIVPVEQGTDAGQDQILDDQPADTDDAQDQDGAEPSSDDVDLEEPVPDLEDAQDVPTDPPADPDAADAVEPDPLVDPVEPDAADQVTPDSDLADQSTDIGSLTPCETSADCTIEGETCGLFSDGEGGIVRLCHRRIGDSELGPCSEDDECQTGFCIGGGFCYWACVNNEDCDGDYECSTITFVGEPPEEDIDVPGCVPPLRTCTSYLDCLPLETCQVFEDDGNPNHVIEYCYVATGTLDSGAVCTDDAECKTNDCFEFNDGSQRCIGPCDPVLQQGCAPSTHCYPDMIMVVFDQGTIQESDDLYDSFATCLEYFGSYTPCESDADCASAPDDETCMVTYNATRTGLDQYCVFPVGAGRGGMACLTDDQCRTDWCYDYDTSDFCFGVCDADGEGSSECVGVTTCQAVEFVIDERDPINPADDITDTIDVCWP